MELVPTVISVGWASGASAYATVALLGIIGRAGVGEVPEPLTGTPVIAVALTLCAIESVVDKIPYLAKRAWRALRRRWRGSRDPPPAES